VSNSQHLMRVSLLEVRISNLHKLMKINRSFTYFITPQQGAKPLPMTAYVAL